MTDRLDELEEELAAVRTTIDYEKNERLDGINRERELEKVVEEASRPTWLDVRLAYLDATR